MPKSLTNLTQYTQNPNSQWFQVKGIATRQISQTLRKLFCKILPQPKHAGKKFCEIFCIQSHLSPLICNPMVVSIQQVAKTGGKSGCVAKNRHMLKKIVIIYKKLKKMVKIRGKNASSACHVAFCIVKNSGFHKNPILSCLDRIFC